MKRKYNKNNDLKINNLQNDLNMIKSYLNNEVLLKINATMNMLEKYIDFKGDLDKFLKILEDGNGKIERAPEKGQKKQAKGSGTSKTGSKNS
jgi:hypothetical protein